MCKNKNFDVTWKTIVEIILCQIFILFLRLTKVLWGNELCPDLPATPCIIPAFAKIVEKVVHCTDSASPLLFNQPPPNRHSARLPARPLYWSCPYKTSLIASYRRPTAAKFHFCASWILASALTLSTIQDYSWNYPSTTSTLLGFLPTCAVTPRASASLTHLEGSTPPKSCLTRAPREGGYSYITIVCRTITKFSISSLASILLTL